MFKLIIKDSRLKKERNPEEFCRTLIQVTKNEMENEKRLFQSVMWHDLRGEIGKITTKEQMKNVKKYNDYQLLFLN